MALGRPQGGPAGPATSRGRRLRGQCLVVLLLGLPLATCRESPETCAVEREQASEGGRRSLLQYSAVRRSHGHAQFDGSHKPQQQGKHEKAAQHTSAAEHKTKHQEAAEHTSTAGHNSKHQVKHEVSHAHKDEAKHASQNLGLGHVRSKLWRPTLETYVPFTHALVIAAIVSCIVVFFCSDNGDEQWASTMTFKSMVEGKERDKATMAPGSAQAEGSGGGPTPLPPKKAAPLAAEVPQRPTLSTPHRDVADRPPQDKAHQAKQLSGAPHAAASATAGQSVRQEQTQQQQEMQEQQQVGQHEQQELQEQQDEQQEQSEQQDQHEQQEQLEQQEQQEEERQEEQKQAQEERQSEVAEAEPATKLEEATPQAVDAETGSASEPEVASLPAEGGSAAAPAVEQHADASKAAMASTAAKPREMGKFEARLEALKNLNRLKSRQGMLQEQHKAAMASLLIHEGRAKSIEEEAQAAAQARAQEEAAEKLYKQMPYKLRNEAVNKIGREKWTTSSWSLRLAVVEEIAASASHGAPQEVQGASAEQQPE